MIQKQKNILDKTVRTPLLRLPRMLQPPVDVPQQHDDLHHRAHREHQEGGFKMHHLDQQKNAGRDSPRERRDRYKPRQMSPPERRQHDVHGGAHRHGEDEGEPSVLYVRSEDHKRGEDSRRGEPHERHKLKAHDDAAFFGEARVRRRDRGVFAYQIVCGHAEELRHPAEDVYIGGAGGALPF